MQSLFQISERMNITKRRAVLFVLGGYTLTTLFVIVVALIKQPPDVNSILLGAIISVILFSGAWWLYFKYNWEPVRYFAVFAVTLVLGISLTGPYLTSYAPQEIIVPTVLALILVEPFGVIVNALFMIGILLVRANGTGIYTDPVTLTIYAMIVGGLLVARLIMETSLHQLKKANEVIRQQEEQSRISQETYRNLFENNPHPMWVYDPATLCFLVANDAAVKHYGYSKNEFLSMTIKDIRPAEGLSGLLNQLAQENISLRQSTGLQHLKKDGTLIDVEITSHSIQFEGGAARLVLANDITERKLAEEELRRSEENYRRIVETAEEGIIAFDAGWHVTFANARIAEILGYDQKEMPGMHIDKFIFDEDRTNHEERKRLREQ